MYYNGDNHIQNVHLYRYFIGITFYGSVHALLLNKNFEYNIGQILNIISDNIPQARSQAEARKPGLQHYMGLDARYPDFVACEQQRRRPACASAQSDERLCYSLSEK